MSPKAEKRRLIGNGEILRYLREAHGIRITRTTLWTARHRKGPSRFPAADWTVVGSVRVVAQSEEVDIWVQMYGCVPEKAQRRTR